MSSTRADRHRNPAAFTSDIAKQGGLILGVDYVIGDQFPSGSLTTARLIGDPIALTIKVIDKIGFINKSGATRWAYITMPDFVWASLDEQLKRQVIGWMYKHEGGRELEDLFQ